MKFEDYLADARRPLFCFAVVLCHDPVLAEDTVSDVLGRAYERWDRVGAADYVHAYVRRMVVNEFMSWHRRLARSSPRADLTELAGSQPDHSATHADRSAMLAELAKLPRKQHAALVLRFYQRLTDQEIAEVLGCQPVTVRSNISRALATLRITMTDAEASWAYRAAPVTMEEI